MYSDGDLHKGGVSPFGYLRINDRSHLPAAFRSVPRPSSPLGAKASTERPYYSSDHTITGHTQDQTAPCRNSDVHCRTYSYSQTTQLFPDKLVKEHTSPVDVEHRLACLLEAGPTGRMVEAMRHVVLISMRTTISNARRTTHAVQAGQ